MVSERLIERVGTRLRSLSDPVRVRIVGELERRPCTVQELADLLGRSHQSTSHHLNAMYHEGLLDRHRNGASVVYCLADFTVCRLLALAQESVVAQLEELGDLAETW